MAKISNVVLRLFIRPRDMERDSTQTATTQCFFFYLKKIVFIIQFIKNKNKKTNHKEPLQ